MEIKVILGILLVIAVVVLVELGLTKATLTAMEDLHGLEPGDLSGKEKERELGWGNEEEDKTHILDVVLALVLVLFVLPARWVRRQYEKFLELAGW